MGKFSEEQKAEIKERFLNFQKENIEIAFRKEIVDEFANIISGAKHAPEAEHKLPNQLKNEEMYEDNSIFYAYHNLYEATLKDQFKKYGQNTILAHGTIDIDVTMFEKYENFMRGMFKDYIAPSLNQECHLKDYRFGRMNSDDLNDLYNTFNRTTKAWAYSEQTKRDSKPVIEDGKRVKNPHDIPAYEKLNDLMNVYPVSSKGFDRDEMAASAAVIYNAALYKYNHRKWYQFWFFKAQRLQKQAIDAAKTYIEALRDPEDKQERGFDQYVKDTLKEPAADVTPFDKTIEGIEAYMEDSKQMDNENPDYDLMNASKDLDKELYDMDASKLGLDILNENKNQINLIDEEEEKDDIINDFGDINTNTNRNLDKTN